MTDKFQVLLKFLDRFDGEVEGRELSEPPVETKSRLQRFARGALPDSEQAEVFALLDRNPEWIAWLAREVKELRRGDR